MNFMMNAPITYTVSARGKNRFQPVLSFLRTHFPDIPRERIDTVFGFTDRCTLYGGRPATGRQLTAADIRALEQTGVGYRIPLTNHFFTEQEYENSRPFLDKYHKPGNALIIVNDDLARFIRRDFPQYRIEASMIKGIRTQALIDQALELYDTVVIPMEMNDRYDFLEKIPRKDRITLFAVAGCAYTCPARTCYRHVSRLNKLLMSKNLFAVLAGYCRYPFSIGCSRRKLKRALLGTVNFDVSRYVGMGYSSFKVMRPNPLLSTAH